MLVSVFNSKNIVFKVYREKNYEFKVEHKFTFSLTTARFKTSYRYYVLSITDYRLLEHIHW